MKILITLNLLAAVVSSKKGCTSNAFDHTCSETESLADQPLNPNDTLPELYILSTTGSITIETFSHLTHVKDLRIMFSNISSIGDGALCALPNLDDLTFLENGELPVLTKSHFINCDRIKHFCLAKGVLETTALENMPNLEFVELYFVNLSHLSSKVLQPLKRLKALTISHTKFEQIDAGAICLSSQLDTLSLMYNEFPLTLTESMFENCNNVEIFEFESATAVRRPKIEHGVFSGFPNLKTARISKLDIGNLSKDHLSGLAKIKNLQLDNCNINTIDEDAFEGLTELTFLSLPDNNITEIGSDELGPLTSLIILQLSNNKITSINNIKHSTLEVLRVNYNLINSVDAEAVKLNLPNLKTLGIDGNRISAEYITKLREKLEGTQVL